MSLTVLSSAVLYLPLFILMKSGRDGWLSVLATMGLALFISVLVVLPGLRFPGLDFHDYSAKILGIVSGKAVTFLFATTALISLALILREFADLIKATAMPLTPIPVVVGASLLTSSFMTRRGIVLIARMAELLMPLILIMLLIIIIFSFKPSHLSNLLPILENGPENIWHGVYLQMAFMPQIAISAFLLHQLTDPHKVITANLKYVFTVGPLVLLVCVITATAFAPEYSSLTVAPLLAVARNISIGGFPLRMEGTITGIWIMVATVKFALVHYLIAYYLGRCLDLEDYRVLINPTALLAGSLSLTMFPDIFSVQNTLSRILPPLYSLVFVAFFVFLLAVGVVRKQGQPTIPLLRKELAFLGKRFSNSKNQAQAFLNSRTSS